MAEPELVAECFASMQEAVDVPITIKTRIGIDEHDSYGFLRRFVDPLVSAGCRKFIVHARIAILEGLSPKENRSIPPLNYERVYQLKQDYPDLEIVINGGIRELAQIDDLLERVDGVMIGRQAYSDPFLLARIEQHLNPDWTLPQRHDIVERMLPYIERELADGERLSRITRHMLGLFTGQAGARAWRRYLSEHAYAEGAGLEVVLAALKTLPVAA
jgi:tRNA-dihydrouridine synthase A